MSRGRLQLYLQLSHVLFPSTQLPALGIHGLN